ERGKERLPTLAEVAAHEPEFPERGDEPERRVRVAGEQPLERRPEVVPLELEPLERGSLARAPQLPVRSLGERGVVASVPVLQVVRILVGDEFLESELADRLQHPHPLIGTPDEALVE